MQNDQNVLGSLKSSKVRVSLRILKFASASMIVLLFAASRDWETVKNVSHETVHRNRIKLLLTERALSGSFIFIF